MRKTDRSLGSFTCVGSLPHAQGYGRERERGEGDAGMCILCVILFRFGFDVAFGMQPRAH